MRGLDKRSGDNSHLSHINAETAKEIKRLLLQRETARKLMEGLTYRAIAKRCGTSVSTVYHIMAGNSWKQVPWKEDT